MSIAYPEGFFFASRIASTTHGERVKGTVYLGSGRRGKGERDGRPGEWRWGGNARQRRAGMADISLPPSSDSNGHTHSVENRDQVSQRTLTQPLPAPLSAQNT